MTPTQLVATLNEIKPRRIVVIKPSALGDVVQTLPLVSVLKQKYPQAEIDWVIRSELADLLQAEPNLSEIIPYYRQGGWKAWGDLLMQLRRRRYDLALDFQGLLRSAAMTAATGAALRVGLETAREYSHLACHGLLPGTDRETPAHARYWRLAELLGLGLEPRQLNLQISEPARDAVSACLGNSAKPLLIVHPGAMWVTKRWPTASFAEVALRAAEKYQMRVAIVGAGGERADADLIANAIQRANSSLEVMNLAGQTSLQELAALLSSASLVLTNDSGPMHLAAGVGTPVVGIFTCTSSVRSGPAGDEHELVQAKVSCAASYRKQCPFSGAGHMQCMTAVSIHQVWTAVQRAIEKNQLTQAVA
ncbi:lipopolysaccharide heptosyltransferase II [bacterium]|nr:lipopolysaccharide heptosyltransferase II [bacterium]